MPCEPFQDALTEAAATGAEPQGDLRAHLKNCPACQAAFKQEQSLFAAIDSRVRVVANAEVPASLLPRVRARLDEMAVPKQAWSPKWFVLAGASAMLAFLFVTQTLWRTNIEPTPVRTATNASTPGPVVLPPERHDLNALPSVSKNSVLPPRTAGRWNLVPGEARPSRKAAPEVLVPRDQEDLLVSYASQWNQRKRAPLVAASFDPTNLPPLQIAPIQIAQLDVKFMTEEQDQ
jgi:hypothetical protein